MISENLIEGKYFFFFKKGLDNKICNLKALKNNEQDLIIFYNTKDRSFTKTTTTNKELR